MNYRLELIKTGAEVVTAAGVTWAAAQYYASERIARIDQTLRILNLGPRQISYSLADERARRDQLMEFFRDRFDDSGSRMSAARAETLWEAGLNYNRNETLSESEASLSTTEFETDVLR